MRMRTNTQVVQNRHGCTDANLALRDWSTQHTRRGRESLRKGHGDLTSVHKHLMRRRKEDWARPCSVASSEMAGGKADELKYKNLHLNIEIKSFSTVKVVKHWKRLHRKASLHKFHLFHLHTDSKPTWALIWATCWRHWAEAWTKPSPEVPSQPFWNSIPISIPFNLTATCLFT